MNSGIGRIYSPNRQITRVRTTAGIAGKTAYQLAVDGGYTGTEEEWLDGLIGKSAYEVALDQGYVGDEDEWLESLIGLSAYQVALDNGFIGTEEEWLEGLKGKSAYQIAVKNGYQGTEEEWLDDKVDKSILNALVAPSTLSVVSGSCVWDISNGLPSSNAVISSLSGTATLSFVLPSEEPPNLFGWFTLLVVAQSNGILLLDTNTISLGDFDAPELVPGLNILSFYVGASNKVSYCGMTGGHEI